MKKIYLLAAMFCSLACSAQSVTTDSILKYFMKKSDKYLNENGFYKDDSNTTRRTIVTSSTDKKERVEMDVEGKIILKAKDSLSAIKFLLSQVLLITSPDDADIIFGRKEVIKKWNNDSLKIQMLKPGDNRNYLNQKTRVVKTDSIPYHKLPPH